MPVVGVDLEPQHVAGLIPQLGLDVCRCHIDREVLPFADRPFAGVFVVPDLRALRVDPALVLSEICRVLEPGGWRARLAPDCKQIEFAHRGRVTADPRVLAHATTHTNVPRQ